VKTITGGLSYRKQFALQALIRTSNPNSRAFDNCFEMGDGEEVVKHVMAYARAPLPEEPDFGVVFGFNSPQYKRMKRRHKQQRLVSHLKDAGVWEKWSAVYSGSENA
jgi:hypothetical protein